MEHVTVKPIKNNFGAEITGLSFSEGVSGEAYQLIHNAVKEVIKYESFASNDIY